MSEPFDSSLEESHIGRQHSAPGDCDTQHLDAIVTAFQKPTAEEHLAQHTVPRIQRTWFMLRSSSRSREGYEGLVEHLDEASRQPRSGEKDQWKEGSFASMTQGAARSLR